MTVAVHAIERGSDKRHIWLLLRIGSVNHSAAVISAAVDNFTTEAISLALTLKRHPSSALRSALQAALWLPARGHLSLSLSDQGNWQALPQAGHQAGQWRWKCQGIARIVQSVCAWEVLAADSTMTTCFEDGEAVGLQEQVAAKERSDGVAPMSHLPLVQWLLDLDQFTFFTISLASHEPL